MKHLLLSITLLMFTSTVIISCGPGKKEQHQAISKKKDELASLQKQQSEIADKILKIQQELSVLDPSTAVKPKLVSVMVIEPDAFEHYIDLPGKIDSRNVAYVSPRNQGGTVVSVLVKEGDRVSKGQTLLKLDNTIYRQQVIAAEQQVGGLKAQLDLAKSVYQRQQNLWKNNIGSEIQVLNAKTQMESLQSQYNAALENIKLAREQMNMTNVTAGISGTINTMKIKQGEFFSAGSQAIQIVNNTELKVRADVPENYLSRVNAGDALEVSLPEMGNRKISTTVSVEGKLIDPITRSFYIEGKIPAETGIAANQRANVRIRDYRAQHALSVPINTVQSDEDGKYILVMGDDRGKKVALKRQVVLGEMYADKIEIRSGIKAGDTIITKGFQGLYEGQFITTDDKK